jgi:hypothetical protein
MIRMRPAHVEHTAGLSLGQAHEFTALAVLETTYTDRGGRRGWGEGRHAVRHLVRFPPGTPYPEIGDRLAATFAAPPLASATLVVDQTGVGKAVVEQLSRATIKGGTVAVTITTGQRATRDDCGAWLVPKKDLVGVLQIALQSKSIQVAASPDHAAVLTDEMMNFRVKASARAENTIEAWREGSHDDLVLTVGVAVWLAARRGPPQTGFAPYVHQTAWWQRSSW